MAIIEIHNLHKTYDDRKVPVHALAGIDLSIERGEFTAIVGPSGSGKTTLLNIIGGLDDPTEGAVMIDGIEITALPSSRRIRYRLHHIGFVFQAYNLIPVLSALENVMFILELQDRPREEREKRGRALLEAVGLADRAHNRPGELSGGQQQRVAVARALAAKPTFILADEPTANLDSKTATDLLDLMADLNRRESMTFLFSTHDQRVMEKARRIITIQDGRVTTDEVRS
jgi:putative ABC transport system ATP-binding protein